jgi:ABC-2 type transport system permease protein
MRRDRVWILPVAGLGILVGLAAMEFMLVGVYRSLLATGVGIGRPEIVVFYGLFLSWAFQFVTAVPIALSLLYYSNDLRLLLTMPVRPVQIVATKGLLLYCYSIPIHLVLFVPALWLYVGAAGFSVPLVLSGILSLFVTPLLPLALSTLFVLGLMKVVNLSRFRVALEVAGMALAIVLLVGLQVLLSRTTISTVTGSGAPQVLSGFAGIFTSLERALPPIAWAARGFVVGAGPAPVLLSLLVTACLVALVAVLAPLNFLSDVMERREMQKGRSRGSARSLAREQAVPHGVVRALLFREWAILSSNSTFIFEAVGELLVLPLVLGVYALIIPKAMVSQAMSFILAMPILSIGLMGIAVLMTSLTTVSATSISREGLRMALSLTLPVAGRTQARAKLYFHLLFFSTAYLVDLVILWVLFRFPAASLLYMVPAGIALHVVGFVVAIFFDLKRPLLKWTHPQQAMKNNMNALSSIGSMTAIVILLVGPAAFWVLKGGNPLLAGCTVAVVSVVLAALLLPRLYAFADRQYAGGLEMDG